MIATCIFKITFGSFSFADKKAGKFKEWLDCTSLIDMKPNTPVMDVFSFLAYETVGQVQKENLTPVS